MKEQLPQFFVGWGTLALINAGLAQGKHRSGLAWFFASLFLGPIATLLIVLLDRGTPPGGPAEGKKKFDLQDYRQQ